MYIFAFEANIANNLYTYNDNDNKYKYLIIK